MYFIGIDLGSSSVKAALLDQDNRLVATASYPDQELAMAAPEPGWAEQDPALWWDCVVQAVRRLMTETKVDTEQVKAIGIAYQMHGLVLVDKEQQVLRPSIIWCDSRAVDTGEAIAADIGSERCYDHLLNEPGNFTFSKLRWVQQNEPEIFSKVAYAMLPGDYIAMRMTGEVSTTISGLSEGTLWDFQEHGPAGFLLEQYGMNPDILPPVASNCGEHGSLSTQAAEALGLTTNTRLSYRAGDQPNNAMALGALEPGEVAATGGTSGVVYAVQGSPAVDKQGRVNGFAHVNHSQKDPRVGILLCINGTGIQHRWSKNLTNAKSYLEMETVAAHVPIGAEGLLVLPFGNGAERMLENRTLGGHFFGLDYNRHRSQHLYRAALEGIACAFRYGMDIMQDMGLSINKLRVGNDNLFQSAIFSQTVSNLCGAPIEVVKTSGSVGAARAAAYGVGHFASLQEAVGQDPVLKTYEQDQKALDETESLYHSWLEKLSIILHTS